MIGAIIGDVVGSRFEFSNTKTKDFELFTADCDFTDDTVMTCAVAKALMRSSKNGYSDLQKVAVKTMHEVGRKHPNCGYGANFIKWMLLDNYGPYNSCGNGSAMRIAAVGDVAKTVEEAKKLAYDITCVSHNHPEGIKGAEAAAVAKVMLKNGASKAEVKDYIVSNYYDLSMTVDDYREMLDGHGKEICQVTMPQAFECFFEGESFEDVIRNCISIGGDSDTIAAIAGGIAEAYYEVPEWMKKQVLRYLTWDLITIVYDFESFLVDGEYDDDVGDIFDDGEEFEKVCEQVRSEVDASIEPVSFEWVCSIIDDIDCSIYEGVSVDSLTLREYRDTLINLYAQYERAVGKNG